jgi:hypothetical protein
MKLIIIFTLLIFKTNVIFAAEFLTYLESAYKNNPTLNAERENYKAFLFQAVKAANKTLTEPIEQGPHFLTLATLPKHSLFLLIKKFFKAFKVTTQ